MRIEKYFCDFCGREVKATDLRKFTFTNKTTKDACGVCTAKREKLADLFIKDSTLHGMLMRSTDTDDMTKHDLASYIATILDADVHEHMYSNGSTVTREWFESILKRLREIF